MKNITKKLLIGVVSLSLLAPISMTSVYTPNITVNAKARIHHKRAYRKHVVKHHNKRTVKKHYSHRVRLTNNYSQMAYQTLRDINKDRRSHGVAPIKETKLLNHLANVRAHQLTNNFSHYDNQGHTYYIQDAKRMRINLNHFYHHYSTCGENIVNAGLDYGNTAYTTMPNNPHKYSNKNGYDMANMDEDSLFNYDSGSLWKHRENILNKNFRNIGIGVARKGGTYYMAEDFDS